MTPGEMIMVPALPRLAWCATIDLHSSAVYHGPLVERRSGWLSEGVWDDDFSADGLTRAQNLFGSAAIMGERSARFFTATNACDRVLVAKSEERVVVANSLPLILAVTDGYLVRDHDYVDVYTTIRAGIDAYEPSVPVEGEEWVLRQYYCGSIEVDFDTLGIKYTKYQRPALFDSFEQYVDMLTATTRRLVSNAADQRRTRTFALATTLSRGYDSTAVSVLATKAGVRTAYARTRSASLWPSVFSSRVDDDGSTAADVLGLRVVPIPDKPEGSYDEDIETAMLGGSPAKREMVFLPMAITLSRHPEPTALFMGHHGGMVWSLALASQYLGPDMSSVDAVGVPMCEARLVAGFVMVALPYVGAEGVRSLLAIGKSRQMQPWRVGGDYDRPIPRRIGEEAGIPRNAFGVRKQAVWGHLGRLCPRHPVLRRVFRPYIGPLRDIWATWQYRVARAANIAGVRVLGRPFTRTAMPSWYQRSSVVIFHASICRLKERYGAALRSVT
jgi:hypothetical protein